METVTNEYARVIKSVILDENIKENMYLRLTENVNTSKYETKKQIAVASVAAIAVAVCISYFVRSGNKLR